MEYVRLGRTGTKVSRICLGCMTFGEPNRGRHPWTMGAEQSRPIIRHALDIHGGPWESPTIELHDPPEGPHPFAGYDVGDYVLAVDEDGDEVAVRIMTMAVKQDSDGNITIAPELVQMDDES